MYLTMPSKVVREWVRLKVVNSWSKGGASYCWLYRDMALVDVSLRQPVLTAMVSSHDENRSLEMISLKNAVSYPVS